MAVTGSPQRWSRSCWGICIATSAYLFIGGVRGAIFEIGSLKLAEAVAVITGMLWGVRGPMDSNMETAEKERKGENATTLIKLLSDRADAAENSVRTAENRITNLADAAQADFSAAA